MSTPQPAKEGWTIYGAKWCSFCRAAKKYFKSNHIQFTYVDVGSAAGAKQAQEDLSKLTNGYKKVPMAFHQGKFVGGWTDVKNHPLYEKEGDFLKKEEDKVEEDAAKE